MDEEQDSIEALRESMLASLGSMVATQRDGTEDFNPMEDEFVVQVLEKTDYARGASERQFISSLYIATSLERQRQIRNARALDRFTDTAKGEEFWR